MLLFVLLKKSLPNPGFTFFKMFFSGSFMGFPGGSDSKESVCNAGDPGLIPG